MIEIKNNIKLTIIMPVFNGWPFIETAIESILNQTFEDFQLLIVNDGSTDKTKDYLSMLSNAKIKIIHKNHSGIIDSFNIALKMVDTKYVARVDADDYYYPTKFGKQIELLEKNKTVIAVGTLGFYMAEKGRISNLKINLPENHDAIIHDLFAKRRAMLQPSVMVRTNILKEINGYRKNIFPEDYDLYFRLGLKGKLYNLKEYLIAVRIHNSFSHKNILLLMSNLDDLIVKYSKLYDVNLTVNKRIKQNKTIYYNRLALKYFLDKIFLKSFYFLFISFLISPKKILNFVRRNL